MRPTLSGSAVITQPVYAPMPVTFLAPTAVSPEQRSGTVVSASRPQSNSGRPCVNTVLPLAASSPRVVTTPQSSYRVVTRPAVRQVCSPTLAQPAHVPVMGPALSQGSAVLRPADRKVTRPTANNSGGAVRFRTPSPPISQGASQDRFHSISPPPEIAAVHFQAQPPSVSPSASQERSRSGSPVCTDSAASSMRILVQGGQRLVRSVSPDTSESVKNDYGTEPTFAARHTDPGSTSVGESCDVGYDVMSCSSREANIHMSRNTTLKMQVTEVEARLKLALEGARLAIVQGNGDAESYLDSALLRWRIWSIKRWQAETGTDEGAIVTLDTLPRSVELPPGAALFMAQLQYEGEQQRLEGRRCASLLKELMERLAADKMADKGLPQFGADGRPTGVAEKIGDPTIADIIVPANCENSQDPEITPSKKEAGGVEELCEALAMDLSIMHKAHADSLADAMESCRQKEEALAESKRAHLAIELLAGENERLRTIAGRSAKGNPNRSASVQLGVGGSLAPSPHQVCIIGDGQDGRAVTLPDRRASLPPPLAVSSAVSTPRRSSRSAERSSRSAEIGEPRAAAPLTSDRGTAASRDSSKSRTSNDNGSTNRRIGVPCHSKQRIRERARERDGIRERSRGSRGEAKSEPIVPMVRKSKPSRSGSAESPATSTKNSPRSPVRDITPGTTLADALHLWCRREEQRAAEVRHHASRRPEVPTSRTSHGRHVIWSPQ